MILKIHSKYRKDVMLIQINKSSIKISSIIHVSKEINSINENIELIEAQVIPNIFPPNVPQLKRWIESNVQLSLVYSQTILRSQHFSLHSSSRISFPLKVLISNDTQICFKAYKHIKTSISDHFSAEDCSVWSTHNETDTEYWQTANNISPITFIALYLNEKNNKQKDFTTRYVLYSDSTNLITVGKVETEFSKFYFGRNCILSSTEIDQITQYISFL